MTKRKSGLGYRALFGLLAGAMLWTLSCSGDASAQSRATIDAGTTITVRTNEEIQGSNSDGRVFSGVVDQDVLNRGGNVAIPRGAEVELLVRNISKNQVALDLESVTVNGQRYGIRRTVSPTINGRTVSEPIGELVNSLAAGPRSARSSAQLPVAEKARRLAVELARQRELVPRS